MKCPHCLADLRYRERSGRTCAKCRHPFALEPRAHELKLSDLKLRNLAERLSRHGRYTYTSAQLGHFAIAQWIKPRYKEGFSWPYKTSFVEFVRQKPVALFDFFHLSTFLLCPLVYFGWFLILLILQLVGMPF